MKLLVHNFLSSKFLKGVTTGYPLKLIATKVTRQESDFEANFLKRMVPRLDWSALLMATRSVAADVALPETLPDQWENHEPLLRSIHQALMEIEVEEASCKNELKPGAAMENLPPGGSSQQEGTEERQTWATIEPQFSQRELSYSDLLRLLSCLEGELQARDVLIALLKAERAKNLLAQARYGRLTWREPLNAFRRDAILEGTDDDDEADHDLTTTYESQLNQLEKLINSQRKANQRSKELLAMVEKKHLKALRELEVERRRRKHDAAQGDDVYMMLEKEREKLQKEIASVREELEQAKAAAEKSHTLLEREKSRHKEIVLYLLQERRQLLVRFAEERAKNLKAKANNEETPETSAAAQVELLKKQLDECTQNLEKERATRAKLEQTVKTQEEDLTLIRQTILNKVKQSSLRQKSQPVEAPSVNTVKMAPKMSPNDQKKVMQLNDRKQPSPLAKSAPGIGTPATSDDFSRYHILSRPKMLCDNQETVAASTTTRVGSSTSAAASPKQLRHQPAAVPCPYTSSFAFVYNASSVFVPPKVVGDHYPVVYGSPGGQMLPSQIPQHNSRRVPQLPSTDYMNTGVRQPVAIRQANETTSYHSPPSYNLALQYSAAVKDQWTIGGVDLTSAATNASSNIPLHTSVGRRPSAVAPTSHVRRPASGSGPQQVCSSAKPAVELTIDEQESIVEPEIAQLEAVINSLIMVSSVNADFAPECQPSPLISCPTCDDEQEISESPSSNGSSGVTSGSNNNMSNQSELKEYSSASVQRPISTRAKTKDQPVPEKTVRSVSRCSVEKCTKGSAILSARKNRRREDRLLVDQQTRKSTARKVSVRATQV
ncbi:Trm112p and CortBP2 domain containing protein [Trichuris trichiura]|uniref:Trm112p and CortBP2 domain containing protein n=1 Tax=Trichuris trichiura TaxID=36087 RepID=A0A077Z9R1_TRITR|nr:Trm112p and CortBP2 domain containing protein [Trichuris trichiura]